MPISIPTEIDFSVDKKKIRYVSGGVKTKKGMNRMEIRRLEKRRKKEKKKERDRGREKEKELAKATELVRRSILPFRIYQISIHEITAQPFFHFKIRLSLAR